MKENGQFRHFGLCDEAGEDKLSPHGCRKQQQVASEEPTVGEIILQAEKIKNVNEPLQTKKKKCRTRAPDSAGGPQTLIQSNQGTIWQRSNERRLFSFFPPTILAVWSFLKKEKRKTEEKFGKSKTAVKERGPTAPPHLKRT